MILKRITLLIVTLVFTAAVAFGQQNQKMNTCVSCHKELDAPLSTPVEQFKGSVHDHPQLSCVGCHGGDATSDDPELSMSRAKGFIGKPNVFATTKLCAKCHSDATYMRDFNPNISVDQYDRYLTSQHGLLLAKGDKKVAVCTSCHGVHDIKKAHDPTSLVYPTNIADLCGKCHANKEYMQEYSIDINQLDEYKSSIHAQMLYEKGDLSAPTCNDCHGNHGAMPPGLTSIANVCGTCHFVQSEYFSSSPHKSAFDELGLAECEACHGNHAIKEATIEMLGTSESASCINCHDENSKGYEVAGKIRAEIDTIAVKIANAEAMLNKARRAGVEIPTEERLHISDARDAFVQAQTLVHTFSLEKVHESTEKGLGAANKALAVGTLALKEVNRRRQMLVVMVVLTLLVAGLLMLYIRNRDIKMKQ